MPTTNQSLSPPEPANSPAEIGLSGTDTKQSRYDALVKARKICRACKNPANTSEDLHNPSEIDGGALDCDEIGAWCLWQGNLDAKVMVVGQDWADVSWFRKTEGKPTSTSPTNTTLVKLLAHAGLEIKLARETTGRGTLFFTNAVLCMKSGGAQASVRDQWFKQCGEQFLRPSIDLVQPQVVICMGTKAHSAVLRAYGLKPRKFSEAVGAPDPDVLLAGSRWAFAVYHCGAGTQNRNRKYDDQVTDWKRIGAFLASTKS
jgi:DNA polymerase